MAFLSWGWVCEKRIPDSGLCAGPSGNDTCPVASTLAWNLCASRLPGMQARSSPLQYLRGLSWKHFLPFSLFIDIVDLASSQKVPMTTPFSNQEPKKAETPDTMRSRLWLAVQQEGAELGPGANVRLHSEATVCPHEARDPARWCPWLKCVGLEGPLQSHPPQSSHCLL